MQAYMSIFGQEGIGRPDIDIEREVSGLKKYLTQHLEEQALPEIQAALVFTNEGIEIDAPDAPAPALKIKQLKDFMRQRAKDRAVPSLLLDQIKSLLNPEESPA